MSDLDQTFGRLCLAAGRPEDRDVAAADFLSAARLATVDEAGDLAFMVREFMKGAHGPALAEALFEAALEPPSQERHLRVV